MCVRWSTLSYPLNVDWSILSYYIKNMFSPCWKFNS